MPSGDVAGLRRKPGPIPEGWAPAPRVVVAQLGRADDRGPLRGVHGDRAEWACRAITSTVGALSPRRAFSAGPTWRGRCESFLAEGVWGTSPHLIPHFALHSASGTISLGLGLHGPNLGVGGGLHAAAEGFLAALTWLSIGSVPGVWLVLSGWSPELVPTATAEPAEPQRLSGPGDRARRTRQSGGRLAFRARVRRRFSSCRRARSTWSRLTETLGEPKREPGPKTVATDPLGRLRIDLIEGPTGQE